MYKGKRRKFFVRLNEQEKRQYILNMESEKADVINDICSFVKKTARCKQC